MNKRYKIEKNKVTIIKDLEENSCLALHISRKWLVASFVNFDGLKEMALLIPKNINGFSVLEGELEIS